MKYLLIVLCGMCLVGCGKAPEPLTLRVEKIEQKDNPYYSSQLYVDTATASIVTVGLGESK